MDNKILFSKKYIDQCIKNQFRTSKNKYFNNLIIKDFCKKINVKYGLTVNSGTSGLHAALLSLELKKDDEVIMPSYTFTSTANAVLLRGAKPVFADVNFYDANLNYESVKKKINKKTKAIIVVHYAGNSCDMQKFVELKKKYNLILIEDCAHSFMGKFKNRYLGTIGDFGTFSFHEIKNFL